MKNRVQWFDIVTKDIERAKEFYTKVFNLVFQFIETPDSKMYMFGDSTKVGSAGCLVQSTTNTPSTEGTILYFSCEDVTNEVSRVEKAGGKLLVSKTSIGEFGFIAQLIDTEGNRIGLHSDK